MGSDIDLYFANTSEFKIPDSNNFLEQVWRLKRAISFQSKSAENDLDLTGPDFL